MSSERFAISLMIGQAALFAAETAMIHRLGSQLSIMEIALLRGIAGLALVGALAHCDRGIGWWLVKSDQLRLQLMRGLIALGYLWVLVFSFSCLPFADATAISYTQATYIAVFSVLILRERVTAPRWIASLIGFGGALLIIRPGFSEWNLLYLIALSGTGLNGLAFVLNKFLQRPGGDSELTTMFFTNLIPVIGNLPVMGMTAGLPALELWPLLAGVLVFGPIGMYLGVVAVRHAQASALAPYTFLRLLVALVGGAVIFREVPDLVGLLGAALIILSCTFSILPGVAPRRGASDQRVGQERRKGWPANACGDSTAVLSAPNRRGCG